MSKLRRPRYGFKGRGAGCSGFVRVMVEPPKATEVRWQRKRFDQEAWLQRIGYDGPRLASLATLQALIAVTQRRSPTRASTCCWSGRLNSLASLQAEMFEARRGGYCSEQNVLFGWASNPPSYHVTSLQARVVGGLKIDAPRPMLHMVLRIELPEDRSSPMWASATWP
jgi:arylamine N-acetyltransferase